MAPTLHTHPLLPNTLLHQDLSECFLTSGDFEDILVYVKREKAGRNHLFEG